MVRGEIVQVGVVIGGLGLGLKEEQGGLNKSEKEIKIYKTLNS